MTPQQFVAIAVRLSAIFMVLHGVLNIPIILFQGLAFGLGAILLIVGSYLLIAALIWFFPMIVTHRLELKTQFDSRLPLSAHHIFSIGVALTGLAFAVSNICDLATTFAISPLSELRDSSIARSAFLHIIISKVITIAVAAGLIFKAEFVARKFLPKVQSTSMAAEETETMGGQ